MARWLDRPSSCRQMDINVALIERKDYPRLAQFDALFIRETTAVPHHTFRSARKAEREGLPVLDDPASIVRCTNKVFLAELLRAHDVPTPGTRFVTRRNPGLMRELGRETSGALSFVAEDAQPLRSGESKREISHEELSQRINERAQVPFMVWDGRVRTSIAGYQDKLPVYLDRDRLYLVEGELASTHILKPEPAEARLPMLVANEHFCMSLARRLGLVAAPVSILRVPDPVLLIERFDRVREAERVRRMHIVDACQALDFPVSYKYERNFGSGHDVRQIRDGASFPRLFSLAEYNVQKAVTRLALVRWALGAGRCSTT